MTGPGSTVAATAVRLRWRPSEAGPASVAAVEIFDRDLRSRARLVVGEMPTTVRLPGPGLYLARGWLPDGSSIEAVFRLPPDRAASDSPEPLVDLVTHRLAAPSEAAPISTAQWALPWRSAAGGWVPDAPPVRLDAETGGSVDLPTSPDHADRAGLGAPLAVQLGTGDGPTFTVLAGSGTTLRVARYARRPEPVVAPAGGPGAALLGYLDAGDLRSAGIVAAHLLGDHPEPGGDPLTDLAVGYFLLRTADRRFAAWARKLARRQRRSPDAALLSAYRLLHGRRGSLARATRRLLAARRRGIPVVAAGMRLLVDGLLLVSEQARAGRRRGRALAEAVEWLRQYQRAMVPGVLTTFTALTPNRPLPGVPLPPASEEEAAQLVPTEWCAVGIASARLTSLGRRFAVLLRRLTRPLPSRAKPDEELASLERRGAGLPGSPRELRGGQLAALRREFLTTSVMRVPAFPSFARPPRLPEEHLAGLLVLRLQLLGGRAAGRAEVPSSLTHASGDLGLELTLRHAFGSEVAVFALLDATDPSVPSLLHVVAASESAQAEYLIVCTDDGSGTQRGDLMVHYAREWVTVAVVAVRTAESLGPDDADILRRSVPATGRRGRNAWRAVARGGDMNLAAVEAIAEALR